MKEKIKEILTPFKKELRAKIWKWSMIILIAVVAMVCALAGILLIVENLGTTYRDHNASKMVKIGIALFIAFIVIILIALFMANSERKKQSGSRSKLNSDINAIKSLYKVKFEEQSPELKVISVDKGLNEYGWDSVSVMINYKNHMFNLSSSTKETKKASAADMVGNVALGIAEVGFALLGGDVGSGSSFSNDGRSLLIEFKLEKLSENIESPSKKIIATLTTSAKDAKAQTFVSESIDFNKNFVAQGSDLLSVTKVFSPKVIDAINKLGPEKYKSKTVTIREDNVFVRNTKARVQLNSDLPIGVFNFSVFSLNEAANRIIRKLDRDFELFKTFGLLLAPFPVN
jgi:uncharacterized membrane protein